MVNSFIHLGDNSIDMPNSTEMQERGLIGLMAEIKRGTIRIPDFQREYIWSKEQILELLDSVWNGYPVGSILLWKTTEDLNERDPLQLNLPRPDQNSDRCYLLDGQQRLITLYSALHGKISLTKKMQAQAFFVLDEKIPEEEDASRFVLLTDKEFADNPVTLAEGYLPLAKMFHYVDDTCSSAIQNRDIINELALARQADRVVAYTNLYNQFSGLKFPTVSNAQDLDVACKIFERLNNTGTKLTVADLMVATTYRKGFNLRTLTDEIRFDFWDKFNYDISQRTILQCISACLEKGTQKKDMLASGKKMHEKWGKTIESTRLAIDFLKNNCYVRVSKFLPYEIILAPLSYFFYRWGNKPLDVERIRQLKKYFWLNMFSERYTAAQSTRARDDIHSMDLLIEHNDADLFNFYDTPITKEDIKDTDMSFNAAFAQTILCFYVSREPREFHNDNLVLIEQTFAQANQSQLHHIFPVNFLKSFEKTNKKYYELEIKDYVNSVANITLLSRAGNRDIWDKKPSVYFPELQRKSSLMFNRDCKSHLIGDLGDYGILRDDFPTFIDRRAERIAQEINAFAEQLKQKQDLGQ